MVGKSLNVFSLFRNFLSQIVNKEFLIFLFFLGLSGLFWLTMALDDTYEKEFTVDVRLAGVPKNVVVTSEMDSMVRFVVRDKGYIIGLYMFREQFHPLFFDFQAYSDGKGTGVISSAEVLKMINQQTYKSSKVTAVKSENLTFEFNYGLHKRVPVRLLGRVVPEDGYYLAHVQFTPDSVDVYASRKVLDSIQQAYTVRQDIRNFSEVKDLPAQLRKIRNAKCIPGQVKMRLFPDVLTEEEVEVPIEAINVPKDKILRTFPGKVSVKFVVGARRMKSMPKNITTRELLPTGFRVIVNYNEVAEHKSEKCHLYVTGTPLGVRNARPSVEHVDYLIEQK